MRHSRSAQFAAAQADAAGIPVGARWNSVSSDPNDPLAVAVRARTLSLAFRPPVADRIAELERRCQGRSVLDIGAVAHDSLRMDSPTWLHGRLAAAAASCLAVDILPDGVEAMRARGFDAVVHDLSNGVGPLAARGPFEVIVAGEIIEHVPDQGMLFRTAQELLAEDGELVITTPNPFAPKRTAAGRRGIVWENTDHILLAFPTGIAELAQRHGLRLLHRRCPGPEPTAPQGGRARPAHRAGAGLAAHRIRHDWRGARCARADRTCRAGTRTGLVRRRDFRVCGAPPDECRGLGVRPPEAGPRARTIALARSAATGPLRAPLRALFNGAVSAQAAAGTLAARRHTVPAYAGGDVTLVVKTFERPDTLRRLVKTIRPVFAGPVLIADDSATPLTLTEAGMSVLPMPFDSGIGAGRSLLLERVDTEFVVMLDDDFILLPDFDIGRAVAYLRRNPEVDLYGGRVINVPHLTSTDYHRQPLLAHRGAPRIRQGVLVDGLPVLYKVPNFYLARTEAVRAVGYDRRLKRVDHNDFFTAAYGRLVCVQDGSWICLHARTVFDDSYQAYRTDMTADFAYLADKWRPADGGAAREVLPAAAPDPERADTLRVRTPDPTALEKALRSAGWSSRGRRGLSHPAWGALAITSGPAPPGARAQEATPNPGPATNPGQAADPGSAAQKRVIACSPRTAWVESGDQLFAAVLPGGPIVALRGATAMAYDVIAAAGAPLDDVVAEVVAQFDLVRLGLFHEPRPIS